MASWQSTMLQQVLKQFKCERGWVRYYEREWPLILLEAADVEFCIAADLVRLLLDALKQTTRRGLKIHPNNTRPWATSEHLA